MKIHLKKFSLFPSSTLKGLSNSKETKILNPSNKPYDPISGILTTNSGWNVLVNFLDDGDIFKSDDLLGKAYKGTGIYLIAPFKEKNMATFFVLVNENELTAGELKRILGKIEYVIENNCHLRTAYWSLRDETPASVYTQMVFSEVRNGNNSMYN